MTRADSTLIAVLCGYAASNIAPGHAALRGCRIRAIMALTKLSPILLTLALTAAASAAQTQPQTQAGPVPQPPALTFKQLTADTKLKMPSGATFTVSSGWYVAEAPNLIVIQEPEKELAAAFVESAAPTAEEAIAEAWKRWKPDFSRTVRQTSKPPVTQGWDEVVQIAYETAADERRIVRGVARRKGKTYYVILVDGAHQRRGTPRRTAEHRAWDRSRSAGRTEENLAGKKPHALDAARAEKLLAFAEEARKLTKVPGVALAVIQDGKIVLEKGLGVLDASGSQPVTPATLFMIGSMTKPLTSLMMARLVDRGSLHVGHAGDEIVPRLRPRRPGGDRTSDDGAHGLRVHGPAAIGHGVHFRVEGGEPGVANGAAEGDEADDRVR